MNMANVRIPLLAVLPFGGRCPFWVAKQPPISCQCAMIFVLPRSMSCTTESGHAEESMYTSSVFFNIIHEPCKGHGTRTAGDKRDAFALSTGPSLNKVFAHQY